jgi:hypothetical protein
VHKDLVHLLSKLDKCQLIKVLPIVLPDLTHIGSGNIDTAGLKNDLQLLVHTSMRPSQ